jgi:bifunctional enzyme CysN/CysC
VAKTVKAIVRDLQRRVNVNSLHGGETATEPSRNEIGRITMCLTRPEFCEFHQRNRLTGGMILIDDATAYAQSPMACVCGNLCCPGDADRSE